MWLIRRIFRCFKFDNVAQFYLICGGAGKTYLKLENECGGAKLSDV